MRELVANREVLWNLVRKELKVKYTASVLGTVWSLMNPVVFMAVFTFVAKILGSPVDVYPVFLLSGLLAWNLFSVSVSGGAQSVIANANLVKKVAFPREVLPLATVGVAFVDFVLQSAVFVVFLLAFGYGFVLDRIWLYPLALAGVVTFTVAVTLWVSSMNVRYRDVQHLIGLALLVWFWMTPIVYAGGQVQERLQAETIAGVSLWHLFLANPMSWLVFGFQGALYHSGDATEVLPAFGTAQLALGLAVVFVVAVALLMVTWRLFFSLSGDFAEEL